MTRALGLEWGSYCLGVALALAAPAARAQAGAKPFVPSVPTVPATMPATDTAHLAPQSTPGGVRFLFHERGMGPLPKAGSRVGIRYTGFLPDGHVFDASAATGGLWRFRVGRREVIIGLDEVLPFLPAGSRARVWIPAALAYDTRGVRHPDDSSRFLIPPNTDLVFELEVVNVR
ncbi:MAG: hypothetical protein JWR44_3448 [Hymenobacter sp.]|nr:hypothetical protein [Hymenobacter sp.]